MHDRLKALMPIQYLHVLYQLPSGQNLWYPISEHRRLASGREQGVFCLLLWWCLRPEDCLAVLLKCSLGTADQITQGTKCIS